VPLDTSRDDTRESHRYGISDLPRQMSAKHVTSLFDEFETPWKRLKECSFPDSYGSILFWVAEAPVTNSQALRGYYWTH